MTNTFNLVKHGWVPIVGGKASLHELFTQHDITLAGTPIEKIAVTKLMLAIMQAAAPCANIREWKNTSIDDVRSRCVDYLAEHQFEFFLYGERPFLQMPSVRDAEKTSFAAALPSIASGNKTLIRQCNVERELDDAERAMLVVAQSSMSLSGKHMDRKFSLDKTLTKKTAKAGPGVGYMGYLHTFASAGTLLESLWLNILTAQDLKEIGIFEQGIGVPPWEEMPSTETCAVAERLKNTYMGRLCGLSRYCLLADDGIHLTEGVQHLSHKDGMRDPSIAVYGTGADIRAVWADPDKKPWRQIPAILGFVAAQTGHGCSQLDFAMQKAAHIDGKFGVWAAGINCSAGPGGDQFMSGRNDGVDSTYIVPIDAIDTLYFENITQTLSQLETMAFILKRAVTGYFKDMGDKAKNQHPKIGPVHRHFWSLCDRHANQLLSGNLSDDELKDLEKTYWVYVFETFDEFCPNGTAKQMLCWAKNRPGMKKREDKE